MYLIDQKRTVERPGRRNKKGRFIPAADLGLGRSERLYVVVDPKFVQASRDRVVSSFYKMDAFRAAARDEATAIQAFQRHKRFAKLKQQAKENQE